MIVHFFIVCRTPQTGSVGAVPTRIYSNLESAVTAAQNLADREGSPFTILQAVRTVTPRDTTPALL